MKIENKKKMEIISGIGSLIACITQIPQIIKIMYTHQVKDIEVCSYFLGALATLCYFIFAIYGNHKAMKYGNLIRLLQLIIVIILYFIFI